MDDRDTVQAMLDAAGLDVPTEEVDRLAQLYKGVRRQLADIHAVDVGDADPVVVFRPAELTGPNEGAST